MPDRDDASPAPLPPPDSSRSSRAEPAPAPPPDATVPAGPAPARPPSPAQAAREARLARALRDNLRRRKTQARAREEGGEG
ncbi:hypothetical protein [Roseomonas sp. BN140053]|uniref:hypothetical protein n=1 Tax=Roseomonas sp. BN140053 TaxID=3391898 RepID=UPI0039E81D48